MEEDMTARISRALGFTAAILTALLVVSVAVVGSGQGEAAAAEVGTLDSPGFFVQGSVDSAGNPVWLSSETFRGTINSCNDVRCDSISSFVVPDLFRGFGFDVTNDDQAVVLGEFEDPQTFELEDRILVCSDVSCDNIISNTPAPSNLGSNSGDLLVRDNNSLLIVEDGTITRCNTLDCTDSIRVIDTGLSGAVTLGADDRPVFLTSDSVIRCSNRTCSGVPTVTQHGIARAVSIATSPNGSLLIGAERTAFDDGAFIPELHRCTNAGCTTTTVEELSGVRAGRDSLTILGGEPTTALSTLGLGGRAILLISEGTQAPAPIPDPVEPIGDLGCTATRTGNNVVLEFANNGFSANIRRDGSWLDTVTDESRLTDRSEPGSSYVLIRRISGDTTEYPCTEVDDGGADQSPCVLNVTPNGVELSWDGLNGNVVFRKNDSWFTTRSTNSGTITDGRGTAEDTYELRHWLRGERTDYACN